MHELWSNLILCLADLIKEDITLEETKQIMEVNQLYENLKKFPAENEMNEARMKVFIKSLTISTRLINKAAGLITITSTYKPTTDQSMQRMKILMQVLPIIIKHLDETDEYLIYHEAILSKYKQFLLATQTKLYHVGKDLLYLSNVTTMTNQDNLRE